MSRHLVAMIAAGNEAGCDVFDRGKWKSLSDWLGCGIMGCYSSHSNDS